jgi:hypothetical protein
MKRDLHSLVKHPLPSPRSVLGRPYAGAVEVAALFALYGLYEVVRGFGSASFELARSHTDSIVALERSLHVFGELDLQRAVERIPFLPGVLGVAYITLHVVATAAVLVWVYRSRRAHFAVVRTSLIVATAISLVIYVLYPAAPPRLAGLGFADTVTRQAGINMSSDLLGSLYNPFAAVPSLHFGYALLVGAAVAVLATNPVARLLGAAYPAFMLFTIVATGNHFVLDAAAGGVVTVAGFAVARRLAAPSAARPARQAPSGFAAATC